MVRNGRNDFRIPYLLFLLMNGKIEITYVHSLNFSTVPFLADFVPKIKEREFQKNKSVLIYPIFSTYPSSVM